MTTTQILTKAGYEAHGVGDCYTFTSPNRYFRIWKIGAGHLKVRSIIDMQEGRTGITDALHFKSVKCMMSYVSSAERNEPKLAT